MQILPKEIAEGLPEVFIGLIPSLDPANPEDWARQDELVEETRHQYWSTDPEHSRGRFIHAFDNWLAFVRSKTLAEDATLCARFESSHRFSPADEANGFNAHKLRLAETMCAYIRNTHGDAEFTLSKAWLGEFVKGHRRSYLFYEQMFDPLYPLSVREEWLIHVLTQAFAEYPEEDEDYRGANLALSKLAKQANEQSLKNILAYWIATLIDAPAEDDGRLLCDLLMHAPVEIRGSQEPARMVLAMYAPAVSEALHLAKTLDMDMLCVLNSFRNGAIKAADITLPNQLGAPDFSL